MSTTVSQLHILRRRHFIFGWVCLLVFLTLGIGLELLHALKLPAYLDVRNTTRRLMWTLAHAHGALFSLIQIAFAATIKRHRGHCSGCRGV